MIWYLVVLGCVVCVGGGVGEVGGWGTGWGVGDRVGAGAEAWIGVV